MNRLTSFMLIFVLLLLSSCSADKTLRHTFDSQKSIDAVEFPLELLGKDFSDNWEDYHYLVMEIKSSTAQRFLLGIDTDNGLHEKRTHILPQAWVRLSVPLGYFREKPRPANDLAATVNKPLKVGFMHIEGGTVGPLTGVKGLSFKFYTPLNSPVIEIRSIKLATEDPGNAYLETVPFVDKFGQWNLADFEGKAGSLEELQQIWAKEENDIENAKIKRSRFGGFLEKQVKGTGYFRVEKIDNRWWFVDPEGYLFLSIGANGIRPGGGGSASDDPGLENMFAEKPPLTDQGGYMPYGEWNQRSRYGNEAWREKWETMTLARMNAWGLNTGSARSNTTPYMAHLRVSGVPNIFGLQDIYITDYDAIVDKSIKEWITQYKDDPFLIGYFLQNEPSWLEQEPRVCELILNGEDTPLKAALKAFLVAGDTPERRTEFVHSTFRKHIATLTKYVMKYDPNHLSLGIRFGHSSVPHDNILKLCKDFFDIFSFNTYRLSPNMDYVSTIAQKTDMPMILGEFHFGTVDRGMAPGLVQVANQQERAVAFRYFAENAFAHPSLIGIAWFQYTDQGLQGRADGERYNIGIVDVTDRPYPVVNGIIEAATNAYQVHSGFQAPFNRIPKGVRGNEDDLKSMSNQ